MLFTTTLAGNFLFADQLMSTLRAKHDKVSTSHWHPAARTWSIYILLLSLSSRSQARCDAPLQGGYREMTMYIEACESGSMFEGLLGPELGIYVTTASNAVESSWGTYCPGECWEQHKEGT
jgi:hypothetical protein